jgi:hypothetical protein
MMIWEWYSKKWMRGRLCALYEEEMWGTGVRIVSNTAFTLYLKYGVGGLVNSPGSVVEHKLRLGMRIICIRILHDVDTKI